MLHRQVTLLGVEFIADYPEVRCMMHYLAITLFGM